MGLLNTLFGSTESTAQELERDDQAILRHWKDYLGTVSKKRKIIESLRTDTALQRSLKELRNLLDLEIADISGEKELEEEIISDLETLEHAKRIKRVHRLEECLAYVETKYAYVHGLLQQLYSVLTSQMQLVTLLSAHPQDTQRLVSHLQSQFALELAILKKIEEIETFQDLFLALVKGEHIIKRMDKGEKRLLERMQKGVHGVFSGEVTEGITREWGLDVFNAVQDIVTDHEAILAHGLDPHPNVDFEFVNRSEFVVLARQIIYGLKKRRVSEQMITVFVHLFREWYNHERE